MKRWYALSWILLIILYLIVSIAIHNRRYEASVDYDTTLEESVRLRVNQSHIAEVMYQQGVRNHNPYRISACNGILFVTYGQEDYIDAYDREGRFLYTILVPEYPNGMVDICTHRNSLFVFSKTDDVYIVESPDNIRYLPNKEAIHLGYSIEWCQDRQNEQILNVNKDYITYCENGNKKSEVYATPDIIVRYLERPRLSKNAMFLVITVFTLVFLTAVIILMINRVRSAPRTGEGAASRMDPNA